MKPFKGSNRNRRKTDVIEFEYEMEEGQDYNDIAIGPQRKNYDSRNEKGDILKDHCCNQKYKHFTRLT